MNDAQKYLAVAKQAFTAGDLARAEVQLKRCLRLVPKSSVANELMAYVKARQGDEEAAGTFLRVAVAGADATDTAWYYLGSWYLRRALPSDAERCFTCALQLNPKLFEATHDLALARYQQGRYGEALEACDRAASLKPQSPEAWHNRGRALAALRRYREALSSYDRAIEIEPSIAETWLNRGEALHDLGRLPDALDSYARARELRDPYPEAEANEGLVLLAQGDFARGWERLEARWRGAGAAIKRHQRRPELVPATPLHDRTVLVWSEQGLGDTIQLCRYVPHLQSRGARVIVDAPADLVPILKSSLGCEVIASGDTVPEHDLQVPFMSLPRYFGTRLETIPANVPYLRSDPVATAAWRGRWSQVRKPVLALACSGRKTHKYENRRRIALALFASLAQDFHLVLAQRDLHDDDRALLERQEIAIEFAGNEMKDMRDAFAIADAADVVVSIDTSLAHVAGALGKRVYILLADVPDWRWMLGTEASAWYPTARLLRQEKADEWQPVLARLAAELGAGLKGRPRNDSAATIA